MDKLFQKNVKYNCLKPTYFDLIKMLIFITLFRMQI